jgi:hypothetical protein
LQPFLSFPKGVWCDELIFHEGAPRSQRTAPPPTRILGVVLLKGPRRGVISVNEEPL